eukprot:1144235-Pelagomonas_calceolata.AAC.2
MLLLLLLDGWRRGGAGLGKPLRCLRVCTEYFGRLHRLHLLSNPRAVHSNALSRMHGKFHGPSGSLSRT